MILQVLFHSSWKSIFSALSPVKVLPRPKRPQHQPLPLACPSGRWGGLSQSRGTSICKGYKEKILVYMLFADFTYFKKNIIKSIDMTHIVRWLICMTYIIQYYTQQYLLCIYTNGKTHLLLHLYNIQYICTFFFLHDRYLSGFLHTKGYQGVHLIRHCWRLGCFQQNLLQA